MSKKKDIGKSGSSEKHNVHASRPLQPQAVTTGGRSSSVFSNWGEGKLLVAGFLLLALFTFIFFSGHLFGTSYFWSTYWSDWTEQNVPFLKINIEAFKNGEIPAWNPYTFGGTPHLADPSTQYYYPLNFLLYLFADPGSLFKPLTNLIVLHYFIAAVGVYLLARFLKIEFWGRIIAAVAYTFSCSLICRWQFIPVLYALAWVPYIFYAYLHLYSNRDLRYVPIAAVLTAILFLTGQPQYFFYQFIILGILLAILLASDLYKKDLSIKNALFSIVMMAIPFVLGIAVCAIQILHTMEYLPLTQRADITLDYATDASLQFQQLKTVIHPFLFGYFKGANQLEFTQYFLTGNKSYHYWETAFFFGLATFILSLFSVVSRIKKPLTIAFIIIIAFSVAHAMGSNSAIYKILFQLPGFDSFRMPARILPFAVLCCCLLAGFALQETDERNRRKDIALVVIILFVLILSITTPGEIVTQFSLAGFNADLISGIKNKAGIIVMLSGILLALAYFKLVKRSYIGIAFVLLIYFELISVNKAYISTSSPPETSYAIDPTNAEILRLKKDNFYRYTPNDIRMRVMRRNQSVLHDISSMDGFYSLTYDKKPIPGSPFNKFMTVKYLSVPYARNPDGTLAYRLDSTDYFPHERMVYRKTFIDTNQLATIKLDSFDYTGNCVITNPLDTVFQVDNIDPANATFKSVLKEYSYSHQSYETDNSNNGLLILGEYYYPAWKAYVDGKNIPIIMTNRLLSGIPLKSGKHTVELKYESAGYQKGKIISIISLVILILVSGISFTLHKRIDQILTSKIK